MRCPRRRDISLTLMATVWLVLVDGPAAAAVGDGLPGQPPAAHGTSHTAYLKQSVASHALLWRRPLMCPAAMWCLVSDHGADV